MPASSRGVASTAALQHTVHVRTSRVSNAGHKPTTMVPVKRAAAIAYATARQSENRKSMWMGILPAGRIETTALAGPYSERQPANTTEKREIADALGEHLTGSVASDLLPWPALWMAISRCRMVARTSRIFADVHAGQQQHQPRQRQKYTGNKGNDIVRECLRARPVFPERGEPIIPLSVAGYCSANRAVTIFIELCACCRLMPGFSLPSTVTWKRAVRSLQNVAASCSGHHVQRDVAVQVQGNCVP